MWSGLQQTFIKLDMKQSVDLRNSHSKDKSRGLNDRFSTRTRSKTDFSHLDHGVAVRTRSISWIKLVLENIKLRYNIILSKL